MQHHAFVLALLGGLSFAAPAPAAHPVLAAAAPAQKDPLVAKAVGRIAQVEQGEAKLAAGDVAAADRLLNQLGWATKRLGAVVQQGTKEWKDAKARHDAVLKKINTKKAGKKKAGGTPPATGGSKGGSGTTGSGTKKQTGNSGSTGQGGSGTGGSGTGGTTPPKAQPYDFKKLSQLNGSINRSYENLKLLSFKHFLDANRVNGMRKEIVKFREQIGTYPAGDDNVKIVTGNLNNFEQLYQIGVDRIAADRKTAPAIEARLATIYDKYSTEQFPMYVEPPFSEMQLRAWARELHERSEVKIKADAAWLDTVQENVVVGANRFASVRGHLFGSIGRDLEGARKGTQEKLDGYATMGVEQAEWLLQTDPKDKNAVMQRVLGKGALDENMKQLRTTLHRIEMAGIVDEELKRANPPSRAAQKQKVELAIGHLKELAKLTLSEVRMPKAASTDAELLKVAAATLKLKKYEIEGWERLVINSKLREEQRREAWFDGGVVTSTITFYDYRWKQFQVTTAEKVGDEIWLFANTLKFYESGDRTTPVGEWILSSRMELTPILAENLKL